MQQAIANYLPALMLNTENEFMKFIQHLQAEGGTLTSSMSNIRPRAEACKTWIFRNYNMAWMTNSVTKKHR